MADLFRRGREICEPVFFGEMNVLHLWLLEHVQISMRYLKKFGISESAHFTKICLLNSLQYLYTWLRKFHKILIKGLSNENLIHNNCKIFYPLAKRFQYLEFNTRDEIYQIHFYRRIISNIIFIQLRINKTHLWSK